jgi:hypothetical protein
MAMSGDWLMQRVGTDEANGGKGLFQDSFVDFEGKRGKFSAKIEDNQLKIRAEVREIS